VEVPRFKDGRKIIAVAKNGTKKERVRQQMCTAISVDKKDKRETSVEINKTVMWEANCLLSAGKCLRQVMPAVNMSSVSI
jgi:hypothetical protein